MTDSVSNSTELYNFLALESYNATPKSPEPLNQTGNEEFSREFVENKFFQIFFCIAYMTIFMLGLTGNMLVVYVVVRNKAMHTVTNLFITNLALSDILLCILAVPFTPLYTFTGKVEIFDTSLVGKYRQRVYTRNPFNLMLPSSN